MVQKPSLGRIVLFRPTKSDSLLPAVITRVWSDECVNLHVFGEPLANEPQGNFPTSVLHSAGDTADEIRSWSWPPRV